MQSASEGCGSCNSIENNAVTHTNLGQRSAHRERINRYFLSRLRRCPICIGMKTGVIDLLAMLLYDRLMPKEGKPVYYTRFQVEIARKIESIITADLSHSHSVREFSEQFGISEGSKNYFFGVFGQSISRYTTHKRMVYAAELLEKSELSVIEIAGSVGYESKVNLRLLSDGSSVCRRSNIGKRKWYPVHYDILCMKRSAAPREL